MRNVCQGHTIPTQKKIALRDEIFHRSHLYICFPITDLKNFSWCNVIQQIRSVALNITKISCKTQSLTDVTDVTFTCSYCLNILHCLKNVQAQWTEKLFAITSYYWADLLMLLFLVTPLSETQFLLNNLHMFLVVRFQNELCNTEYWFLRGVDKWHIGVNRKITQKVNQTLVTIPADMYPNELKLHSQSSVHLVVL